MEKERLEGLIIDYIDDRLNAADREILEQELANSEEARKLYDDLKVVLAAMETSETFSPSGELERNFRKALEREIASGSRSRSIFFNPLYYRVAAAIALVVLGGGIGFWISKNNAERERFAELQREMEITRQELQETKQLMLGMLENDLSASQRIKGVNVALEMMKADDEIVGALFNALNSDPNTNVRLAALAALSRFSDDPVVKKRLVGSLAEQKDPMVQIKLIQLMVEMREKGIVEDLQKIVNDATTIKAVKDEAYSGILKLS